MTLRDARIWILAALVGLAASPSLAVSPGDLSRLTAAGLSDATLEAVVRERVVETAAFPVDDLLRLRAAGIGDDTIRVLVETGSFLRRSPAIVYGRSGRPLRLTSVADLLELKAAGCDDRVLEALVAAAGDAPDGPSARRAMEMLRELSLEIVISPDR
jgi:hypothetical protein